MINGLSKDDRVVILGAGPTGLGAAIRLKELGHTRFHVYERAGHVGGLAASFKDEKGFTWDVGGHVQFSHYRYFDLLMDQALGDGWLDHQRESWVWIEDRFVPYPFQNNIRHLTLETRWRCLKGLVELYKNPPQRRPRNFREWIEGTFGKGMADVFMLPYNFKVWAYPPEELDFQWVGERVAAADLTKVLDHLLHEKDDLSWGPNTQFRFPERGGTGRIWERVADLLGREMISLRKGAARIEAGSKLVHFSDGSCERYDALVSTAPIDDLIELCGFESLKPAASALKYSASNVVGVGLSGRPPEALRTKCWMYFPEDNCPFYRVTVFSNYSPYNVPDPDTTWSLMAEISESPCKRVDAGRLVESTLEGMRATGLINNEHQIISTWSYKAKHGYPTPSLGRDAALNEIHAAIEPMGIYSRGRFGGWKYEVSNQDHSLMQGVELVDRLLLGVPEVTYWFPGTANNLQHAKLR